nr:uncharacterized protein LOC113724209 [Coffea arabica]
MGQLLPTALRSPPQPTSSDHSPLLCMFDNPPGPTPTSFRFQHMWVRHSAFREVVYQNWNLPFEGYGMYALAEERVRRKEICLEQENTEAARIEWSHAQANLLQALAQEEIFWKQKAWVKWLKDGNSNSKFFHSHAAAERRAHKNGVFRGSQGGGVWVNGDNAAGADGFSGLFFRHCWDFLAQDIHNAVQEFLIRVPIPKSISRMLIVLISKKDACSSFADFRPISLCTFVNKIFSKVLCNPLKTVLPSLISNEQSGFVQGREIADNILLAQELVGSLDRKSYASFWLSPHFVVLLLSNLSAGRFSLLVNGKPYGFFPVSSGLKQGDPLSPYLFNLVAEALSRGLNQLFLSGKITSYGLPRRSKGEHDEECLCSASPVFHGSRAAGILHYWNAVQAAPNRLLGMQAICKQDKSFLLPALVDNLNKRLVGWKGKLLSAGDRMILIKHVLAAIPLYTLAVLDPSKRVLKQLEQLMSNFFWGATEETPKRYWLSWDKLCYPVEENGLGFRKLGDVQQAFACKL